MNLVQFVRIIWARWPIIASSVLSVFLLALVVVFVAPPKYKAESRVMLDIIKPDPVTGQVLPTPFLRAFTQTQTQLIKDFGVATRAVEELKWADDPKMIAAYRNRKASDDRDFLKWAAQQVIDHTEAQLIEGSNIIEITYTSDNAQTAKRVTDAIRHAYIDLSLENRREQARRNADWYGQQADKAKEALLTAEAAKASFERANGIILQDDRTDVDSARLAALAMTSGNTPMISGGGGSMSPAAMQLAQLDAAIADASQSLGPNHPTLIDMKHRREVLAKQVAQDRDESAAASSAALSAARATAGLLEAQKSRVMAQREKVERLRLLQNDIDLARDQYNKASSRTAELRQEAQVAETGVTPLGAAITPQKPIFPNKPLILLGSIGLGLGVGFALALLLEMIGRRIRGYEDLEAALDAPVLAIVEIPGEPKRVRRAQLVKRLQRPRKRAPELVAAKAGS